MAGLSRGARGVKCCARHKRYKALVTYLILYAQLYSQSAAQFKVPLTDDPQRIRHCAKTDFLGLAHILAIQLERHWPGRAQFDPRQGGTRQYRPAARRPGPLAEHVPQRARGRDRAQAEERQQVEASVE